MNDKKPSKKVPVFAALIVVSLWIATPFVTKFLFLKADEQGQFGDLFGSVNALFSGLALAGLIYTIYLQHRELSLQREELNNQREEMKQSREQLTHQANAQLHLVNATIAQIQVAAIQAEIEALKVKSRKSPNLSGHYNAIHEQSTKIEQISKEIQEKVDTNTLTGE